MTGAYQAGCHARVLEIPAFWLFPKTAFGAQVQCEVKVPVPDGATALKTSVGVTSQALPGTVLSVPGAWT